MRPLITTLLTLAVLTTAAASAEGAEAEFPKEITVQNRKLEQLGAYRYVYRFFFPLYDVALYTESRAEAEDVLNADVAFHLTFRYLRDIEKPVILKAADRMLDKNLSSEEQDQIAERVRDLNTAYTGVEEGDTSSLTYDPEKGTTLRINGESRTTISGQDFARLYFRIWLGPEPLSDSLRDHLLGNK